MPNKCPVCLNMHSDPAQIVHAGTNFRVDCPVCGHYILTDEAWTDLLDPQTGVGHNLSELSRATISHTLRSGSATNSSSLPMLTVAFLKPFVEGERSGPIRAEQATNIIKYIGNEVSRSGLAVERLPVGFYAIIGAPNPELAARLARELVEIGILSGIDASTMGGTDLLDLDLTLGGWKRYEEEKRGRVAGNYGFLAMKFEDDTLDPFVKNILKPTVKNGIGYDLFDMRDVARTGVIDNIMRSQIRDAAFVIADLTHNNSGAYWEAGYAEGLGKPVLYICEKTKFEMTNTHFDTNHSTTVLWSTNPKEYENFGQELVATLRRALNLFQDHHG